MRFRKSWPGKRSRQIDYIVPFLVQSFSVTVPSEPETPQPILEVRFFRTTAGNEPVREWLKSLTREDRKRIGEDIKTAQFGWPIGMPLIRKLEKGALGGPYHTGRRNCSRHLHRYWKSYGPAPRVRQEISEDPEE